jgi:hypothetical protein
MAAAALEEEFGFAPARLSQIAVLEADNLYFYIRFRIGRRYYASCHGKIERTDERGSAI